MANGKLHAVASWVFLGGTCYAAATLIDDPVTAVSMVAGSALGLLLSPDLDHQAKTEDEQRIYRWFGLWPGKLWQLFWRRYERRYAHRGISHAPILGTWTRWRYILIRLLPLVLLSIPYLPFVFPYVLICFVFHSLQDMIHWALDGFDHHRGAKRAKR